MYLSDYVWQQLYDALMEEDPSGVLAGQFASYFDGNPDTAISGYHEMTGDYIQYERWLQGLFGTNPQDYAEFISWDPNMTGTSGQQGGGFKILP